MRSTTHIIHRESGLTLLELILICSVIAILAAIAYSNFSDTRYKGQIASAVSDIRKIEFAVNVHRDNYGTFPTSLAAVGFDGLRDPWGQSYDYWPITGDPGQQVRKDRNLHPINTDFDLFSRGRDGNTNQALTARQSQDDIIRARNGAFVDLASKY
jgi:general secretion pathway protein G